MVPNREPVTIRLYGNRRLYRSAVGRTVDEVLTLANGSAGVVVRDAQSGADITEFVLSRSAIEH